MKPGAAPFAQNEVLFGRDNTPGIVSAQLQGDDRITVYRRLEGKITTETQSFRPFLWVTEQTFLQGFDRKVEYVPLTGSGAFKFLVLLQSWPDFQRARNFLRNAPVLAPNDPVQQYLMATGRTSFKGMRFAQLHRLQIALTAGNTIQLADNTGWQSEVRKPDELVAVIRKRDPDVIEGHDIFRSILPRIAGKRSLKLGRDGSVMSARQSRVQIAERTIQYPKYEIHGRQIVDTFLLAVFYDVSTRELESFDLDEVAGHFGLK